MKVVQMAIRRRGFRSAMNRACLTWSKYLRGLELGIRARCLKELIIRYLLVSRYIYQKGRCTKGLIKSTEEWWVCVNQWQAAGVLRWTMTSEIWPWWTKAGQLCFKDSIAFKESPILIIISIQTGSLCIWFFQMIKSKSKMIEGSYNRFVGCQREQIRRTKFFLYYFNTKRLILYLTKPKQTKARKITKIFSLAKTSAKSFKVGSRVHLCIILSQEFNHSITPSPSNIAAVIALI